MKSLLKYRVCEFSNHSLDFLSCVASFQYLYDVVMYMMLNPRVRVVLVRNDKGQFVRLSNSSILAFVEENKSYFIDLFDEVSVSNFMDGIAFKDDRK